MLGERDKGAVFLEHSCNFTLLTFSLILILHRNLHLLPPLYLQHHLFFVCFLFIAFWLCNTTNELVGFYSSLLFQTTGLCASRPKAAFQRKLLQFSYFFPSWWTYITQNVDCTISNGSSGSIYTVELFAIYLVIMNFSLKAQHWGKQQLEAYQICLFVIISVTVIHETKKCCSISMHPFIFYLRSVLGSLGYCCLSHLLHRKDNALSGQVISLWLEWLGANQVI